MIQEAVTNTVELELYLVKSASSKWMLVTQKDPKEQAAVAVIQWLQTTQKGLRDMMQRLVERVEQLNVILQKNPVPWVQPSNHPLMKSQANWEGPVVCYHCGQPGH